ncbi:MAG: peptide chain release factor N(5)-glutamine methyltransferase [Undibacterium sp.]|uniref:peptide chain release factor N(5)-glutamine methyltransferase n=1 Tax=Undibacterium sp. TaxID=1914977 RepID=UPI00271F0F98|nr:peptide chain release factor N(5)-glutamine methyltransferase [Undibacterium sp.]MDO8654600.1 peptide chain release factor N(5)-glutamine methyltransferase [Undibacterium sp.]
MSAWLAAGSRIADSQSASPLDALETRMLLMHVLGLSRVQLITHSEQALSADQVERLNQLILRRVNGEPMAYILGEREFYGLDFYVTPDVLIPRPDTELLVELALQYAPRQSRLLDLGTGSGAIAIAVAQQRPDLTVLALDVSPAALKIAEKNAARHLAAGKVQLIQSDWYSAIADQQFATIVSNPPYIVKDDQHLSQGDLRFEPLNALTDHADGLSAYRQIITGAGKHLAEGGWLLMEHGYDQSSAVQELLSAAGFSEIQSWPDLAGILRVSGARLP